MNRVLAAAPRLAEKVTQQIVPKCRRTLMTSPIKLQERCDISKLKAAQKNFQIDDGTPIYLKGGLTDRILFGVTVALIVYGIGYSSTVIYTLAVPPKN